MLFCSNCDSEAIVRLEISEAMPSEKSTTLALCARCKDAFDWGFSRGESGDSIEELETI